MPEAQNRNGEEGEEQRPGWAFLPHARDKMKELGVSEEEVKTTVQHPDYEGEGHYDRSVADRDLGGQVVRVIYNVGQEEYIIVSVMRRRRVGGDNQ